MKKNNFIIGSTGFIGSEIRKFSVHDFIYVDRNLLDLSKKNNIKNYFEQFNKIDFIIFLVGLVHQNGKKASYKQHFETNYITLKNLLLTLEEIKKPPENLIFTSTVNVYGTEIDSKIFNEDSQTAPKTSYSLTKKLAEELLINQNLVNYWILRLAPVYSRSFQLNIKSRTKYLNLFYRPMINNISFSLCNAKNITVAIDKILEGKIPTGIYNISDNRTYTFDDLLKYKKAKFILKVPHFIIFLAYKISVILKWYELSDKLSKLLKSNIFPSSKIGKYVNLPEKLC